MSRVPTALLGRPLRKKSRGLTKAPTPVTAPVVELVPEPVELVPEPVELVDVEEPAETFVEVTLDEFLDDEPTDPPVEFEIPSEDFKADVFGLSMANSKAELIAAAESLGFSVDGLTKQQILDLIAG